MARTLARLLVAAGEPLLCIAARDPSRAWEAALFAGPGIEAASLHDFPRDVSHVLIAVSDSAVHSVAAVIAAALQPEVALHTSGVAGPDVLNPLRSRGTACGTLHPLQTVTGDEAAVASLYGAAFGICGDAAAFGWARHIAGLAQGTPLCVQPERMPLYHAAAVLASNSVTALVDASQSLFELAGLDPDSALRAIAPLLRASVENALRLGPLAALTGPIARGDVNTVVAHRAGLASAPPRVHDLYCAAALHALDMSRRRGLSVEMIAALEESLRA